MPKAIDSIKVPRSSVIDNDLILVLRDDLVIEIYFDDSDGQQYAGNLTSRHPPEPEKTLQLLRAIKSTIKEKPFSTRSHDWLHALSYRAGNGLLRQWESQL